MNKYVCAQIEGGGYMAKICLPVCVFVPICLLRRADDESFLVLPA